MNLSVDNYIYSGTINHRRFTPFKHFFDYSIFMVYFDISKTDAIFEKSWLWNPQRRSIVSFNRNDYHGEKQSTLDYEVRKTVKSKLGKELKGPIRILTHLRYFGYCFNPVSFYYCFDEDDNELELIMAEVTNTPWKERHTYFVYKKNDKKKKYISKMKKELHVSPFWGMDHDYEWLFSEPSKNLLVNMKNFNDGKKVFDATLSLKRKKMTTKNLFQSLLFYPFITILVVLRIHWNAVKLWFKGAKFYVHPDKVNIK